MLHAICSGSTSSPRIRKNQPLKPSVPLQMPPLGFGRMRMIGRVPAPGNKGDNAAFVSWQRGGARPFGLGCEINVMASAARVLAHRARRYRSWPVGVDPSCTDQVRGVLPLRPQYRADRSGRTACRPPISVIQAARHPACRARISTPRPRKRRKQGLADQPMSYVRTRRAISKKWAQNGQARTIEDCRTPVRRRQVNGPHFRRC